MRKNFGKFGCFTPPKLSFNLLLIFMVTNMPKIYPSIYQIFLPLEFCSTETDIYMYVTFNNISLKTFACTCTMNWALVNCLFIGVNNKTCTQ